MAANLIRSGFAVVDPVETSPSTLRRLESQPVLGQFCVDASASTGIPAGTPPGGTIGTAAGGAAEGTPGARTCTTDIVGYTEGSLGMNLMPLQPQNTNDDEFTPEQLEQFKTCLSAMFKVYYKDHKYDRNGEAYFDGHSDTRASWYSIWSVGTFRVTTDQKSYSSADLKRKFGPLAGSRFGGGNVVGFTDKRSPYVNAIANDAAGAGPVKGREFLGLWVYELGNALSVITNITPEIPADAEARYGIAGESGAAFEDCVFGGRLNQHGTVTRPGQ